MKTFLSVCLLLLVAAGCDAQTEKPKKTLQAGDTAAQPKARWKVNKKYDDKGNLIAYDSTYTWTYSGKGGQDIPIEVDSVMNAFRKRFNSTFPSMFNNSFGSPVWNDSLFFNDFLRHDYFIQRYNQRFFDMEGMMRSMDSVRNNFLQENYPGLKKI
jgi:hypothetical protein